MQKQTKPEPLAVSMAKTIMVVAIIASLGVVLGVAGYALIKQKPVVQNPPTIKKVDETADWKVYRNEEYNFEFRYPDIILASKENNIVLLTHAVNFIHPDPCDFKGDGTILEKLIDFKVKVEVMNKNLRDAVIAKNNKFLISNYLLDDKLKIEPGFIDDISTGSLKGYRITSGVEGCGEYAYYFPLDSNNTLITIRSFVAELNPAAVSSEECLEINGIIKPEQEENIFNQILSTFKFIEE